MADAMVAPGAEPLCVASLCRVPGRKGGSPSTRHGGGNGWMPVTLTGQPLAGLPTRRPSNGLRGGKGSTQQQPSCWLLGTCIFYQHVAGPLTERGPYLSGFADSACNCIQAAYAFNRTRAAGGATIELRPP